MSTVRDRPSPEDRDMGPRDVEVHFMNRALYVFMTPELKRLGVGKEDIVKVRYEAARRDAMGRPLTRRRIIIEAYE